MAGLLNGALYLGGGIGPLLGGGLASALGFGWAATVFGLMLLLQARSDASHVLHGNVHRLAFPVTPAILRTRISAQS